MLSPGYNGVGSANPGSRGEAQERSLHTIRADAHRDAHRRRRLSRAQCRDSRGRAQGDRRLRRRDRRVPGRVARCARGLACRADDRIDARDPASRRNDPRELADQPLQARRRGAAGPRRAREASPRRADRDRRGGHARRREPALPGRRQRDRRSEDDRQRSRRHRRDVRVRHRAAHRHRGDRPAAHDRGEPQPDPRGRGDGPHGGLDRAALGGRRRRRRDPDPGDPVRHRRGLPADPPPSRARPVLLDRRRGRGRDAQGGDDAGRRDGLGRRVRPSPAGRNRVRARARDREPHRLRDPRHGARPRAAWWHSDRVRPGAGDEARARRDHRGARRASGG